MTKKLLTGLLIFVLMAVPVQAKEYTTFPPQTTSFKSYESYKAITKKTSPQYILQQNAVTGPYGVRLFDNCFMVAVGTGYNAPVGTKLLVELDTGVVLPCVVGDIKANIHTDATNMVGGHGDVLEFIVDIPNMDKSARRAGDMSAIDCFKGNVKKVTVIDIEQCAK